MVKNTFQPEKRDIFMKNGNESRDVLGDSRKRYRCPWAEIGNTDRVKNQSDCRIRYRPPEKKNNTLNNTVGKRRNISF